MGAIKGDTRIVDYGSYGDEKILMGVLVGDYVATALRLLGGSGGLSN